MRAAMLVFPLALACAGNPRPESSDARTEREPETISLLGRPLYAPPDTLGEIEAIGTSSPVEAVEAMIAMGQRLSRGWRYSEAVDVYTRALAMAPDDPRLYRHRGHRYISLRRFEEAARDLDRGARLDSTSFDIAYHRGLAHYLLGHFAVAAEVYGRCIAQGDARSPLAADDTAVSSPRLCADIARDDDSRVAITDWRYRALRRAGRADEAATLLATIRDGMRVTENASYYDALLVYAGRKNASDVLAAAAADSLRWATTGYGLASVRLASGDTASARALLERIARSPHWPAFGVIAAEADLVRLGATPRP